MQQLIEHRTAQATSCEARDQQHKGPHRGGLDGVEIADGNAAKQRDQGQQRDGCEPALSGSQALAVGQFCRCASCDPG